MIQYSVQPRDQMFAKGYELLFCAKKMVKNIGKKISKNLSGKYSQKPLDDDKQLGTDAFKTASKRAIEKTEEATGDLIVNKITDKITKISKNSQKIIQR